MPKICKSLKIDKFSVEVITTDAATKCGFLEMPGGAILFASEDGKEFQFRFSGPRYLVVPSILGLNPLTGLRASVEPWTSSRGDFCPADHGHGRLGKGGKCLSCGHTWAAANYLSAHGGTTLSGWRVGEGEYRPFVSTNDVTKDVVSAVDSLSSTDSIGFAFYEVDTGRVPHFWWGTPGITLCGTTTRAWNPSLTHWPASNGSYYGTACTSTFTSSVASDTLSLGGKSEVERFVGASKEVVNNSDGEDSTGWSFFTPEDAVETPVVIQAKMVSWEFLKETEHQLALQRASGPLKGIPLA